MKKKFFLGLLISIVLFAFVACNMEMDQKKFNEAYDLHFTQVGNQLYLSDPAENAVVYYACLAQGEADDVEDPEYLLYKPGQPIDVTSKALVKAKVSVNGRDTDAEPYKVKAVDTANKINAAVRQFDDNKLVLSFSADDLAKIFYFDSGLTTTAWNGTGATEMVEPSQFKEYSEPIKATGVVFAYAEMSTGKVTQLYKFDCRNDFAAAKTASGYEYIAIQYEDGHEEIKKDVNELIVRIPAAEGVSQAKLIESVTCNGETATGWSYDDKVGEITLTKAGKYVFTLKNIQDGTDAEGNEVALKTIEVEMKKSETPALTIPTLTAQDILAALKSVNDISLSTEASVLEELLANYIHDKFEIPEDVKLNASTWKATRGVAGEESSNVQEIKWNELQTPSFTVSEDGEFELEHEEQFDKAEVLFFQYDFVAERIVDDKTIYAHFENVIPVEQVTKKGKYLAVAIYDGCYPSFYSTEVNDVCPTPAFNVEDIVGGKKVTVSADYVNLYVSLNGAPYTTQTEYVFKEAGTYSFKAYAKKESMIAAKAEKTVEVKQLEVTWETAIDWSENNIATVTATATATDVESTITVDYLTSYTDIAASSTDFVVEFYAKANGYLDSEKASYTVHCEQLTVSWTDIDFALNDETGEWTLTATPTDGTAEYVEGTSDAVTSETTATSFTFEAYATKPGYLDSEVEEFEFTFPQLALRFSYPETNSPDNGYELQIDVVDQDGEAVEGATIAVRTATDKVLDSNTVTLTDSADYTIKVKASKNGYLSAKGKVDIDLCSQITSLSDLIIVDVPRVGIERGGEIKIIDPQVEGVTFYRYYDHSTITDFVYEVISDHTYSNIWNGSQAISESVNLYAEKDSKYGTIRAYKFESVNVPFMQTLNQPEVTEIIGTTASDYGYAKFHVTAPTTSENYETPVTATVGLEWSTDGNNWTPVVKNTFEASNGNFRVRAYAPGYINSKDFMGVAAESTEIPEIKIIPGYGKQSFELRVSATDANIYYKLYGANEQDWTLYTGIVDVTADENEKTYIEVKYLEKGKVSNNKSYCLTTSTDVTTATDWIDLTIYTVDVEAYPFVLGKAEAPEVTEDNFTTTTSLNVYKFQSEEEGLYYLSGTDYVELTSGTDFTVEEGDLTLKIYKRELGKINNEETVTITLTYIELPVWTLDIETEQVLGGVKIKFNVTKDSGNGPQTVPYWGLYEDDLLDIEIEKLVSGAWTHCFAASEFGSANWVEAEDAQYIKKFVSNSDYRVKATLSCTDFGVERVYTTTSDAFRLEGKLVGVDVTATDTTYTIEDDNLYYTFDGNIEILPSDQIERKVYVAWADSTSSSDLRDYFAWTECTSGSGTKPTKTTYAQRLWVKVEAVGYESVLTSTDVIVDAMTPISTTYTLTVTAVEGGYKISRSPETTLTDVSFYLDGVSKTYATNTDGGMFLPFTTSSDVGMHTLEVGTVTLNDLANYYDSGASIVFAQGANSVVNLYESGSKATFNVNPKIATPVTATDVAVTTYTDTASVTVTLTTETNVTYYYKVKNTTSGTDYKDWTSTTDGVITVNSIPRASVSDTDTSYEIEVEGRAVGTITSDSIKMVFTVPHKEQQPL